MRAVPSFSASEQTADGLVAVDPHARAAVGDVRHQQEGVRLLAAEVHAGAERALLEHDGLGDVRHEIEYWKLGWAYVRSLVHRGDQPVEGYIRRGYLASILLANTEEMTRTGGDRAADHSDGDDYGSGDSDGYDADEYFERQMTV